MAVSTHPNWLLIRAEAMRGRMPGRILPVSNTPSVWARLAVLQVTRNNWAMMSSPGGLLAVGAEKPPGYFLDLKMNESGDDPVCSTLPV